jgi:hypothetical protein
VCVNYKGFTIMVFIYLCLLSLFNDAAGIESTGITVSLASIVLSNKMARMWKETV